VPAADPYGGRNFDPVKYGKLFLHIALAPRQQIARLVYNDIPLLAPALRI
jgi:hypothetical protein